MRLHSALSGGDGDLPFSKAPMVTMLSLRPSDLLSRLAAERHVLRSWMRATLASFTLMCSSHHFQAARVTNLKFTSSNQRKGRAGTSTGTSTSCRRLRRRGTRVAEGAATQLPSMAWSCNQWP